MGHYYFCFWLFGRPVTDTEAVPSSETPGAQASVGCFTDPGRSFDFHVSSAVRLSVCQVGVRAYVVPLRVCTASVSHFCVISCKFASVWWIPGYFKWVKENPQLRLLVISESHCEYVINVFLCRFHWVGNGLLYFQKASS